MKPTFLKNLARDERGNVTIMVSLALPMLALVIGGGADYANILQRKSQLQNAVDSAALATHLYYQKHPRATNGELKAYFDKYLKSSLSPKLASVLKFTQEKVQIDRKNDVLRAWVKADTPTSFIRLAAINKMNLSTFAEVKASPSYTEVALVLDTTGSMSGHKIAELKQAATTFLNTIYNKLKNSKPETFKVAIVPFSRYVNVGMQYRNAPWISVPRDRTIRKLNTSRQCRKYQCVRYSYRWQWQCWWTGSRDGGRRKVCRPVFRRYCANYRVTPIRPCITHRWYTTRTVKWKGCVGSRRPSLNIKDEGYGTRVPGVMNYSRNPSQPESSMNGWYWNESNYCPTALTPLTPLKTGRGTLISKIKSLTTDGWTYIPAGLVWGWRVLSPQAPFTEGASWTMVKQKNVQKIIVLMTDGKNTHAPDRRRNRSYADHTSSDSRYADQLLTNLCNNIKATNPATGKPYADIITITFDVRNANIKNLLRQCSTLGSYDASSGQLVKVFDKIAKELVQLHLSQ